MTKISSLSIGLVVWISSTNGSTYNSPSRTNKSTIFLKHFKINTITTSTTIKKIEVAFRECNETNATCSGGYIIDSNTI
jgi:hypothetical protein